jgi:uncharacterized DUF497 family protein
MRFEWDQNKAVANETKHDVSFEEATAVFYDPMAVIFPDRSHSSYEERFKIIGFSASRLLLVVFVEREEDLIRIISARRAARVEKKRYEKGE